MLRPSATCCGCASLLVGVEAICLVTLITQVATIALCSSDEPIYMASVRISPFVQVLLASWAFAGIPLVILAGVGALYRIEANLRLLVWYMLVSLLVEVCVPIWFLVSGQLCGALVSDQVQRLGSALVCSFTDTFVFFWTLLAAIAHMYMVYIVWSAAEEISQSSYPELLKYAEKLQAYQAPSAPEGPYPVNTRAVMAPKQESTPQPQQALPPTSGRSISFQAQSSPLVGEPFSSSQRLPSVASPQSFRPATVPVSRVERPSETFTPASRGPASSIRGSAVPSTLPPSAARVPVSAASVPMSAAPPASISSQQSFMPYPSSGVNFQSSYQSSPIAVETVGPALPPTSGRCASPPRQ
mmetsp:Transcript_59917/g.142756  ORF Transcript_59917/g.142756 Transcript_59917/m.142756 type:complete len:356 (-) Transcript_59917:79-1146(-)